MGKQKSVLNILNDILYHILMNILKKRIFYSIAGVFVMQNIRCWGYREPKGGLLEKN